MAQRIHSAVLAAGGPTQVSALSGVPLRTLHHYFNGREPKAGVLARIANSCGVNEEWLLKGDGPRGVSDEGVAARLVEIAELLNDEAVIADPGRVATLQIELEDIEENTNIPSRYQMFANRLLSFLGDSAAGKRVEMFESGYFAGMGAMRESGHLDQARLTTVLVALEAYLTNQRQTVDVKLKAAVLSSMYELAGNPETSAAIVQPKTIEQLLKLASNRV